MFYEGISCMSPDRRVREVNREKRDHKGKPEGKKGTCLPRRLEKRKEIELRQRKDNTRTHRKMGA